MSAIHNKNSYAGISFAISAFSLFALVPMYVQLLKPLSGYTLLNQRILWSSILLILILGLWGKLKEHLSPLKDIKAWPGLISGSLLIGLQWGLFVWAPLNNQTLDLSLGYFLVPLVMVFIGKVFLKEKLRPLQWLAIIFAIFGVSMAFLHSNGLSWVVILIAIGYPLYLIVRRIQVLPSISAFLIENLILLPAAILGIVFMGDMDGGPLSHPFQYKPNMLLLFFGLAIMGSVPMMCFIAANKRLNMSTLGLISYLEPALIFLVAIFFLGEELKPEEILIYIPIIFGLLVLALDGIKAKLTNKFNMN